MSTTDRVSRIDFRGQPALELVTASGARALVSLFGGQVLSWIPAGGEERLYLSARASFDANSPIRGGAPVCWPQFAELGRLPRHGLVRTRPWKLVSERAGEGFALVTLRITDDDDSWSHWPHAFALELSVLIEGGRLSMELEVENTGHGAFVFTGALHTYLRTREVEQLRLKGLQGKTCLDRATGAAAHQEERENLIVNQEIDRIYRGADRPLVLQEPHRGLAIQSEGFTDAVVWNPWEEKCAALADMEPQDFRRMLCVEAALSRPTELAAGESWSGRQTLVDLA